MYFGKSSGPICSSAVKKVCSVPNSTSGQSSETKIPSRNCLARQRTTQIRTRGWRISRSDFLQSVNNGGNFGDAFVCVALGWMDNVAEWSPETMISNCLPIIPCLRTVFTASGVWEGIGDPRNPFRSLTMHSQPANRAWPRSPHSLMRT
jgi:hypothetical protein